MDLLGTGAAVLTFTFLTFLLAGFVKGLIGLGLPTVAVGLLSVVMPPAQAAALLIVPAFVTNVWQLAAGPRILAISRRFWPMMMGICIGTYAGAGLLTGTPAGMPRRRWVSLSWPMLSLA